MTRIDRRRLLALAAAAALPAPTSAASLPLIELPGQILAPDFVLPDLAGTMHRLADRRGHPVLVNFWAVWCPPCRRELGALAELRIRVISAGIEVLAINLGDRMDLVTAFLAAHPAPDLPVLIDAEKTTAASFHVQGLPVTFALDGVGVLRLGALGERDWRAAEVEAQLRALM